MKAVISSTISAGTRIVTVLQPYFGFAPAPALAPPRFFFFVGSFIRPFAPFGIFSRRSTSDSLHSFFFNSSLVCSWLVRADHMYNLIKDLDYMISNIMRSRV